MWTKTITLTSIVLIVSSATSCAGDDGEVTFRSIEPVCVEDAAAIEAADWVCEEALVIDCNTEEVPAEIYVLAEPNGCGALDLATIDGPFAPGVQDIVVIDDNTGDAICTTTLEIHDEVPPQIETRDQSMWPPNHKFHTFTLEEDCFAEVIECDPHWTARLTYVASDEAPNDRGDGNTEPDIEVLDETTVQLRAERQGGSNGRVYTLGWLAEDTSGNVAEGTCRVSVDHDRGHKGTAVDDGEAYRIDLDPPPADE